MLKLVLDTNTLVSAFFWKGYEEKLFRKIEQGKSLLFISQEIIKEIEDVINRPKFKQVMINANLTYDQIIQKIISIAHLIIGPKLHITIIEKDPADNKILECAVNSKVNYIVSGDKHLLKLKEYKGIKIVKTKEVLKLI
jgi:putative PIN family toxin of toxin-antitoxin system